MAALVSTHAQSSDFATAHVRSNSSYSRSMNAQRRMTEAMHALKGVLNQHDFGSATENGLQSTE
jgi:hypothetical protein